MKVLVLSPYPQQLVAALGRDGTDVTVWNEVLDDSLLARRFDFTVCLGYRRVLTAAELDALGRRAINLHISYLPWNRGAHPNFWSFFDATPKGVSVHLMDEGIDTGDILAQREVAFGEGATLATTYRELMNALGALFEAAWPNIRTGRTLPHTQATGGSFHRKRDIEPFRPLLKKGWDTPVVEVERIGRAHRRGGLPDATPADTGAKRGL